MTQRRTRFPIGLEASPTSLTTNPLTRDGEIAFDLSDSKLKFRSVSDRAIVTEDQTQILTNKTLDADTNIVSNLEVDNFKSGVLNTSTSLSGASNTQVPSALAVKTYVDNKVAEHDQASEISYNNTASGLTATNVQDAIDEVDLSLKNTQTILGNHIAAITDAHDASAISTTPISGVTGTDVQAMMANLKAQIDTKGTGTGDVNGPASATNNAIARFDTTTGKLIKNSTVTLSDTGVIVGASIDASQNTVSDLTNVNISPIAAIARNKLASGTAYRLLANNSSGVMSENAALTVNRIPHADVNGQLTDSSDFVATTNAITLANTKHLEVQASTDSTTTGSNATMNAFTAGAVRLTNSSLVSLATIPAGSNGQKLTIFNRTGVDFTIPVSGNILTGTGSTITVANNSALAFDYDSTSAKWQIIGGTGSGTGTASLDTILQLTASEQLTDWSTGNNATVLGGGVLAGTFVKNTSTPLHGTASYQYTQAAGSLNDYLLSAAFPVDLRFRGQQVYFSAPYQYNGNTNDIQVIVYCATTSTVLTTTSDVIVGTNAATQTQIVGVVIPVNCQSVRVGFQVKILNSGKVLSFDDVQLSQSLYQAAQLNNETDWQPATFTSLTWTGLGAITNNLQVRRDGPNLKIKGNFTPAAPDANTARIPLPTNFGTINSLGTASDFLGKGVRNVTAGAGSPGEYNVLFVTYTSVAQNIITLTTANNGQTPLTPNNANQLATAGQTISIQGELTIPIQGWSVGNTAIVTPIQQISSDTIPFTFKATAIVDSDPIGTFNTYTYAINTNTATISGSAPTQTVASMNTDGFRLFTRAFNAASTTASPARVVIKLQKGLESINRSYFESLARVNAGNLENAGQVVSNTWVGVHTFSYNKTTGNLTIDCGYNEFNGTTNNALRFENESIGTSAYFVFTASTAPSIAALPVLQPRIATLSDVKASGTAGGTSAVGIQTRTLNTIVDTTGIVTSLSANQFTLPRGRYYIEAGAPALASNPVKTRIRNITDGTTALVGSAGYSNSAGNYTIERCPIAGEITITASKVFELQQYISVALATNGLGIPTTTGESEVYSIVKITKIADLL